LGLCGNSLSDGFAAELDGFLDENTVINELDISCNQISLDNILDLKKKVLGSNRFFTFLVNNNDEVSDALVQEINNHCR